MVLLYENSYQDEKIAIEASMNSLYQMNFHFSGRGSSNGVVAFIDILTKMHEHIPNEENADALLNCLEYGRTPLLSQLQIGKWLLRNKKKTGRISIVGAKALEVKIAKAIMRIARIDRIAFFKNTADAYAWLGWELPSIGQI